MYRELGRQQAFSSSPVIASSSSSTHQLLPSLSLTRFSFNAIISYFAPVPTGSVLSPARFLGRVFYLHLMQMRSVAEPNRSTKALISLRPKFLILSAHKLLFLFLTSS